MSECALCHQEMGDAVPRGALHHPGCDMERCPRCGLQSISCDCMAEAEMLNPQSMRRADRPLGPPKAVTIGKARLGPPPHWAGAHSLDLAWESVERVMADGASSILGSRSGSTVGPRVGLMIPFAVPLSTARPIVVDARQVDALPTLSRAQACAYAGVAALPHDPVYLDFAARTGGGALRAPSVRITERVGIMMIGALVMRPPLRVGELTVLPFGRLLSFHGGVVEGVSENDVIRMQESFGVQADHETWFVSPGDDADISNVAEPIVADAPASRQPPSPAMRPAA